MSRQKFIVMALLLTCLFLSGCANGDKKASNGEQVTLKFWYPGTDELVVQAVKERIAGFEQQYANVKVELTAVPWAEYFQKLSIAYSGGVQPDVHGLGFGQLISTVGQGKYLDLQPFIERDNWQGSTDFYPDILQAGQWQNRQYGLLLPEVRPLAWRKDFFEEAGLDANTPPKTVEELFQYAEVLKLVENQQTTRAGIDIQTSNGEQSFLSLLLLFGEDIYDDEGNPTFDSDSAIELLERLVELYNNGAIMPANQQQIDGTPFVKSQAALAFVSTASAASLINAVGADNIGWSLPPAGPAGARTALVLGTFLTAAQDTKHPEEAWNFIKYWFEPDNILAFSSETGFIPPLQSLKEQFVGGGAEYEVSFEAFNQAKGYRPSEFWAIHVKYLRLALEEAYNGIKTPAEALRDNAKLARDEIESL